MDRNPTDRYYGDHAETFFARTVSLDLADLYGPFLERVPPGGRILDAGCGSGRDAAVFLERGYRVTAFDASPELVRLARRHTGLDVRQLRFEDMVYNSDFDGVWACASLLHVPRRDFPDILPRFVRALVPGGAWYMSFRLGTDEIEREGRRFNNQTEASLRTTLTALDELRVEEIWSNCEIAGDRCGEDWVNAIATRLRD